jgi:ketosteroid isomerase-like protein
MSRENVELARRAYDAVNRRDLDAFLAVMDEEVEAISFLVAMEGEYQGHAGISRWWENILDVFPDFNLEVVEVRDLGGDSVIATLRWCGHGAGSGTPVDLSLWITSRIRAGKCVWWRAFGDKDEALEAAGLPE